MADSFWLTASREGFAQQCIARFGVDFNHADAFIVRSEFIKTKGRASHQLQKTLSQAPQRRRAGRSAVGTRHSMRMVQQVGNLIEQGG